jgi:hypothetical protein
MGLNLRRYPELRTDPALGVREHALLELGGDQRVKEIPRGVVTRKISGPEVHLLLDAPGGRRIEGTPGGWRGKRGGKYRCRKNETDE